MRLIGPDDLPPPREKEPADPRCFSFHLHRRRSRQTWWEVRLVFERENRAASSQWMNTDGRLLATKADARAWAKRYAEHQGFPYREYVKREPTAEQLRGEAVHRGRSRILWHDDLAEKAGDAGRFREAAEHWAHAAKLCVDQFALEPGSVPHLRQCAETRIAEAITCLKRWGMEVSLTQDTAGLQRLPGLLLGLPRPQGVDEPTP